MATAYPVMTAGAWTRGGLRCGGSWRGLREADIKESLATERDGAEVISTLAPAF